jgi:hypothetical protein
VQKGITAFPASLQSIDRNLDSSQRITTMQHFRLDVNMAAVILGQILQQSGVALVGLAFTWFVASAPLAISATDSK